MTICPHLLSPVVPRSSFVNQSVSFGDHPLCSIVALLLSSLLKNYIELLYLLDQSGVVVLQIVNLVALTIDFFLPISDGYFQSIEDFH